MKVLVIGGTRFIGKAIARRSAEAGHDVLLFNRGKLAANPGYPAVFGDVDEILRHKDELRARKPDVIVHCIAYTEKHARDCVETFQGLDAQTIVLGSQDCYEAFRQINLGKEVSDYPIHEGMELSQVRYYWKGSPHLLADSYDKNLLTDILMDAHENARLRTTVFRLPMVYGPEDPQLKSRHGSILRRIHDKRKVFVMGQLSQARIWTFGFVDNIAAAVVHAYGKESVSGGIYNLGETQVRSWRRWAELYAKTAGWSFDFESVPEEVLQRDPEARNAPPQHMIVDCTRYVRETDFAAPVSLEQRLRETLEWAMAHPESLGDRPDYEAEENLLKAYA